MNYPINMFIWALLHHDYWKEFRAGSQRLALTRYKMEKHCKRSRYSLFVFPQGDEAPPSRCYNWEPDDPEDFEGLQRELDIETDPQQRDLLELMIRDAPTSPIAFFGEHVENVHLNNGEAPNDLTIEQFRPLALSWAASLLGISDKDILPVADNEVSTNKPKQWWRLWLK